MLQHIQLVTRMMSSVLVQKVIYKNQLLKQNQSTFLRVFGYNESTQVKKTTKRALIMSKREHKKKNPRKHLFVQSQQYKH